ncbi:MAG: glutamine synthetase III [Lentimicrobiaceae bacterium]|nr:glutamine synthetase III [Lentimicrobiaceae bacterium]
MENFRFIALEKALGRTRKPVEITTRVSQLYGEYTFSRPVMQEYLPAEAYHAVMQAIEKGVRIRRDIADIIASGMKAWAVAKGATHYTHWFHPLTGSTAEKHDAFLFPGMDGQAMEIFSGSSLVQQEPDASSFPSGGIRNTFEARGYTAWDPSSPAFILDRTLCIPTVFVSYTGESLDFKAPLLRSLALIDQAATAVCRLFDRNVNKVIATLGWEQEYFLVDAALHGARPDLMLTGRTVFGHASAKDQQLSDHYFGTIPERVTDFMREYELEAFRLGIPVRTRHNEVAPGQFECAPVFEEANLAVDHNQILMHLMQRIARRHDLTVLFHEKPFSLVNGSGKHNNWSLMTNMGENLLSPGPNTETNLRFLAFLTSILMALNEHADLLRASIASPSNDLRLGAHEAPPAIISAFIGEHLSQILNKITGTDVLQASQHSRRNQKSIPLPKIPEILPDNTDRNRTSPFAFTGNKFELRAVGASANCAAPMIALNTIVADRLLIFVEDVKARQAAGESRPEAILNVVREYAKKSERIRFEGNCYSEEWKKEAAARGLSDNQTTVTALQAFISKPTISVFERRQILTERELHARYEIRLENYIRKIQIESRVIGDLATNHVIPVAIHYQNTLIENVRGLRDVLDQKTFVKLSKVQLQNIRDISDHINQIRVHVSGMIEARKEANQLTSVESQAQAYDSTVKPFFSVIRYHVDKLELMVDDERWPLPKYRELLFIR